eukprot:gnl/MRDRNA2_/MRDRNA2_260397_c0_seq1.p1 gnl/MRDRNA2_/MRDRNA2_260397_c0~~gnl/MRDRNA2_/MRDRNA2_260397_c0_seq1.p1  ORF type:complete len:291 (-),score=49.25 gnl/MRDRNA2_/MRDRNA2_260397_c0_seq1:102-974(-)
MEATFLSRLKVLFLTHHPVISLQSYSIVSPHKVRTLIYWVGMWNALFLASLFFSTSGDAISIEDPVECAKEGVKLVQTIIVSVISSAISSCSLGFFNALHHRDFVFCNGWDEKMKHRLLAKWRFEDMLLLTLAPLYIVFCILFVGVFLSAVTTRDRTVFSINSLSTIFQAWFLIPFVMAALLAGLVGLLNFEHPRMQLIEKKLGLTHDDIEKMFHTAGGLTEQEDTEVAKGVPGGEDTVGPPPMIAPQVVDKSKTKDLIDADLSKQNAPMCAAPGFFTCCAPAIAVPDAL